LHPSPDISQRHLPLCKQATIALLCIPRTDFRAFSAIGVASLAAVQGARIAETPDTKPASCWMWHPRSQCHGRAFRGEGSVICTTSRAANTSTHAHPRLGRVHPQFHERPRGRLVHHFMTKFEGGTVTRLLRQTSKAARHSRHDEEMRGRAATRAEKVSTKRLTCWKRDKHITLRRGLAWIREV